MRIFKFKVTQTDTYIDEIEIEASGFEEAERLLKEELDEDPLDNRKDTYTDSTTSWERVEEMI